MTKAMPRITPGKKGLICTFELSLSVQYTERSKLLLKLKI